MRSFFSYQVSFWWANKEMTQFSDTDLSWPWCHQRWAVVKHGAQLIAESEKICETCSEQLSAPGALEPFESLEVIGYRL